MLHCYIHVTSNYVPMRFRVFAVGVLSLLAITALAGHAVITSL